MRLINADKLIKDIDYSADLGGALGKVVEVVKTYAKFMVQTAPTVDAIPVEWLRNKMEKSSGFRHAVLSETIEEWEGMKNGSH